MYPPAQHHQHVRVEREQEGRGLLPLHLHEPSERASHTGQYM
jgi:hypothetical protein